MKKILILFISILITVPSYGCMYRLDIQRLAIVMAMGIDIGDDGSYKVSFQVLQSGGGQEKSSGFFKRGSQGEAGVLYFEGKGETIYAAMNSITDKISKKEHFGQLKVLIIGQKAAEAGIGSLLDFLGRFNEIRANLIVFVTKGEASAIVGASSYEDSIPADTIDELAMNQIHTGNHPVIYLSQLIDTMAAENRYPVLGVINLPRRTENTDSSSFKIDGMAVFEGDKLIAYLTSREARAYQYIMGKVDIGDSVVKLPGGRKISLEILGTTSKIQTEVIDGKPRASINIRQDASVREMPGYGDPRQKIQLLEDIGGLQAANIETQVEAMLDVIQGDLKRDIIDIGGHIYRQHPGEWEKIEGNWKEIFPDIKIKVNAECRIRGTGLLSKPVH